MVTQDKMLFNLILAKVEITSDFVSANIFLFLFSRENAISNCR